MVKPNPCAGCRHFRGSLGRNGTELLQSVGFDTQNVVFHLICVADNSAFVHAGAAGNGSQRRTDTTAGEAFRRDQRFPLQPVQNITA